VELQRFFIGANGTGRKMGGSFSIVDPGGRVASQAGDSGDTIFGKVDLEVLTNKKASLRLVSSKKELTLLFEIFS